jgi:hypothetical protein
MPIKPIPTIPIRIITRLLLGDVIDERSTSYEVRRRFGPVLAAIAVHFGPPRPRFVLISGTWVVGTQDRRYAGMERTLAVLTKMMERGFPGSSVELEQIAAVDS